MKLKTMISEMRRTLTETDIAVKLGVAQSTVNRIGNGKMEPSWTLGEKIRDLHRSVTEAGK